MARFFNLGAETGHATSEGLGVGAGVPTFDTTSPRSGARNYRYPVAGTSASVFHTQGFSGVIGNTYFFRGYFRWDANPATTVNIIAFMTGTTGAFVSARLSSTGQVALWQDVGTVQQIGSATAVLALNTWHMIELSAKVGTGATDDIALRVNGIIIASATGITMSDTNIGQVRFGWIGAPGTNRILDVDDVAMNDSTGTEQNSWPGAAKIVFLRPISDAQVGSWVAGASTTVDLWNAIDNIPPVGVAAPGTATSQINSSTVNGAAGYRANLQSYDAAGIPSTATIRVLQILTVVAEAATTGSKAQQQELISNPAVTPDAAQNITETAAGTFPTGWATFRTSSLYNPAGIVRSTSPVVEVRRTDTGGRSHTVCLMGLWVEYEEGAALTPISATDSTVIGSTDRLSIAETLALAQTDATALAALEAIVSALTTAQTDTTSIGSTAEVSSAGYLSTSTDATTISGPDATSKLETASKASNDASAIGSTDVASASAQDTKTATDAGSLGSSETVASVVQGSVSDTTSIASPEAVQTSTGASLNDASSVASTDSGSTARSTAQADSTAVGSTDSSQTSTGYSVADAGSVTSPDSGAVSSVDAKTTTDTTVISAADTTTRLETSLLVASDATVVSATEARSISAAMGIPDTTAISTTEALSTSTALTAFDAVVVSSTDSVATLVLIPATDTTSIGSLDSATASLSWALMDAMIIGSIDVAGLTISENIYVPFRVFVAQDRLLDFGARGRGLIAKASIRDLIHIASRRIGR